MDDFGIGTAMQAMARIYFETSRMTGRSTHLAESISPDDVVVFSSEKLARHFCRLVKEKRKFNAKYVVSDPKYFPNLFDKLRGKRIHGKLIFDHVWLELFYEHEISALTNVLDTYAQQNSGYVDERREEHGRAWLDFS